ncbi:MAG: OmpA family protein [Bacteroidales bacterium]
MKKALVFLFSCLLFSTTFAQEVNFKETFLDGDYFLLYEEYADALPFFLELYEIDPDNANICYRIGMCYINLPGQKEKAIPYLEKAVKNTTTTYREGNHREDRAPLEAYYYLGAAYRIQERFDEACQIFDQYLALIENGDTINRNFILQQINACENAREYMKNPVPFDAANLGPPINDQFPNFKPVTTPDEETLIFVTGLKFYDAIFYTEKSGTRWSDPVNLSPEILSDGDMYPTCLSSDGNQLFLSKDDDFNSDIYLSRKIDGEWQPAEKIGKNVNTKYWENHACVSEDGSVLIFTSNKPGGYGGFDLYLSRWDETIGDWGPAENMGPAINTPFNEETPFMVNNGKTIYFSSQGHETMGGYDVFTSSLDDDGNWSTPVNLGYPINTSDEDLFFMPVNDGINAYFARYTEDGYGQEDIYRYEIYSDKNPRPVLITGKVTLEDKTVPEVTDIKVNISGPSGTQPSTLPVDPSTGEYHYTSKVPGTYALTFTCEGYEPLVREAHLPSDYSLSEVMVNATLVAVPPEIITLKHVYFAFDRATITAEEKAKLDKLVKILEEHNGLNIEIIGHTDAIGPAEYNQKLSERRAGAVRDYLISKGIGKTRISVSGKGENNPIARNRYENGADCPEGRALNRRAEIHVPESGDLIVEYERFEMPDDIKIR